MAAAVAKTTSSAERQSIGDVGWDLKSFLERNEGSALKAWLKFFDDNNDQRVTYHEFCRGMRAMGYDGNIKALFESIDIDGSGELSLSEIDEAQDVLWRHFRSWCVKNFANATEIIQALSGTAAHRGGGGEGIPLQVFRLQLRQCGWQDGFEDIIFEALDPDGHRLIDEESFAWFAVEAERHKKKELARLKHAPSIKQRLAARQQVNIDALVRAFKDFLKAKYGCYIRAWRDGLSPDGMTVIRKPQFLKACAVIGWHRDVKALWKAFDRDDSGYMAIDELDLKSAEMLARFHRFIYDTFGSAQEAFHAFDKHRTKRASEQDFAEVLRDYHVPLPVKHLFRGLARKGNKHLVEDDLLFLDSWKPLPFLCASPNHRAVEDFKSILVSTYRRFLRAWRRLLDRDGSNRCNWDEFLAACKKVNFQGDIPGAWRALDSDLSGFITLYEIDPESNNTLLEFKDWATHEFGCVRAAFSCFDEDGSNQASLQEFRRSCRIYGFDGDAVEIFRALDVERSGTLSAQEVGFLDEWDFSESFENVHHQASRPTEPKKRKNASEEKSAGPSKEEPRPVYKKPAPAVVEEEDTTVPPSLDLAEKVYSRLPVAPQLGLHGGTVHTPRSHQSSTASLASVGGRKIKMPAQQTPRLPRLVLDVDVGGAAGASWLHRPPQAKPMMPTLDELLAFDRPDYKAWGPPRSARMRRLSGEGPAGYSRKLPGLTMASAVPLSARS
eukprot:TRINITY_DN81185_c0_g1_i1.p1 TRINITY_DN81185_c0_g1~~TRINITY_DN81185_c0_g1_i1.p1  ORF type:complete len:723 (+),score=201.48 TRINITY_DN81185_c0_g1_i1:84-2252(+)